MAGWLPAETQWKLRSGKPQKGGYKDEIYVLQFGIIDQLIERGY